jgi:phosphoribosylamine--glycine ligase
MKVLVVGSGGREHAILWALKQSPLVTAIYCAPGNGGTSTLAENIPISSENIEGLCSFAKQHAVDLTVVGNEGPLVMGIVDRFTLEGLKIFGPSKAAARLEGSKIFLKNFLQKYEIPTARFRTFTLAEYESAQAYIRQSPLPLVIKTDGLAAGKGVAICETHAEAFNALREYFEGKIFGDAGTRIVVEEFMAGEEASIFAICDGKDYVILSSAQDHKRIGDNDTGKNTGGMGAYAPAPVVTEEVLHIVESTIIRPTLEGMIREASPYRGCLYIGLMITKEGPKVVEYNVRLGDPETQVVLPLIESDLFELLYAAASGTLGKYRLTIKTGSAVVVVLAAQGYPDQYEKGKTISGLEEASKEAYIFHAGTKQNGQTYLTSGGRVLGVATVANNLRSALDRAYSAAGLISFEGKYFRTDIGKKGLLIKE